MADKPLRPLAEGELSIDQVKEQLVELGKKRGSLNYVEITDKLASFDRDARGVVRADIVLVGVSRTSKTPLSQYLAHKRLKVMSLMWSLQGDLQTGATVKILTAYINITSFK